MNNEEKEKIGTVKISDDVIAVCAASAALKTNGIAGLSGTLTEVITRNILGKEPLYKGVKVSQNDEGCTIDLFVVVKYGVKIPAVAWDLQENVKKDIENMTMEKIKTVNVHIQGVQFPEDIQEEEHNK